jgi:hypothetical protein
MIVKIDWTIASTRLLSFRVIRKHVPPRRSIELDGVFAVELRDTFIANRKGNARDCWRINKEPARLVKPDHW